MASQAADSVRWTRNGDLGPIVEEVCERLGDNIRPTRNRKSTTSDRIEVSGRFTSLVTQLAAELRPKRRSGRK
jgi:hypothetical protein